MNKDEFDNYVPGKLFYGATSYFSGIKEDITRCVQSVSDPGRYGSFHPH